MILGVMRKLTTLPLPAHAAAALASVVWFQWSKGKLDASYAASLHPVDYMTGQTSFSGETIKGYYRDMIETGTLDVYVTTQLIDFAFILGFLGIGLFVCTLIARLCRAESLGRKIGAYGGLMFVIGALCDMIENGVSFALLADPSGFAEWLAVPYSLFACLKFGFITLGMGLVLVSLVFAAGGRGLGKPNIG